MSGKNNIAVHRPHTFAAAAVLAVLAGCGGGSGGTTDALSAAPSVASDTPGVDISGAGEATAHPVYHVAPVLLDAPSDIDADGREASADVAPLALPIPFVAAALSTAQRVPADLQAALAAADARSRLPTAQGTQAHAEASGSGTLATVYTPAQIRAAYGLTGLPAARSANPAAWQGAGQTIYLITAYHNPNVVNDLAVFSRTFGLPPCAALNVPAASPLPLAAAAAGAGCTLSVVSAARSPGSAWPGGVLSSIVPAVDRSWATESALDVEWAHAIAPLARIVLIEAPSSRVADLAAAVDLAARMGPGVVSMSFGVAEFAQASMLYWGLPFGAAGMSFVAANGDAGSQVNWPAVDTRVLAIGGTTLAWNGATRGEVAWAATGGAISKQVAVPAYQAGLRKPGDPTTAGATVYRGSADVAFNANPYSGQYTYVTPSPATGGTGWIAAGGTSIGAPQWAGLLAVANAVRASVAKAPVGVAQTDLYTRIAAVPGLYASAFADVSAGRNGNCGAMCDAVAGYDLPTGLGTPNGANLLGLLAGF